MQRLSTGLEPAFLSALICFISLVPVAAAKPAEDRDWITVQTDNFRIVSAQGERKTLELARHLEMFRVAAQVTTNIRTTKSPIPINIYAFKAVSDLSRLGYERKNAGLMVPGLRDYTLLVRNTRGMSETSIILHEYVHFLIRNHSNHNYPRWFDEGFAEYLSTGGIRKGTFEVGKFPEARASSFALSSWIPIKDIISPQNYEDWSDEKKSMFYAEAWALVHYLVSRPGGEMPSTKGMKRYLELSEAGIDDIPAFEEAFEISVKELNKRIKNYLYRNGKFAYLYMATDYLLPEFNYAVSEISREQISLELGSLALRSGEFDRAQELFAIAATDAATRPRAEAGLGDVFKFSGDYDAAQPYFEKAIELAPNDPYCQLDMAEYWHTRAGVSENSEQRKEFFELARKYYVQAWKLDDSMPETFAMYGRTYVEEGQDYDKAIEMLEEAAFLMPSDLDIRIWLGQAYAEVGRENEAEKLALSVLAWSHAEGTRTKLAKAILARIDGSVRPESQPTEVSIN